MISADSGLFGRLMEILLPDGGYVVALHEAYLDESYTDAGVPLMVVGGYLIRSDNAKAMDAEWQAMLGKYGVPYFHMVDVAPCQGIFKPLGMAKCDQLEREAIQLIKKYVTLGCTVTANPLRLAAIFKGVSDPYTQCLNHCVVNLCAKAYSQDREAKVAFFFESGHGTGSLIENVLAPKHGNPQGVAYLNAYISHTFAAKKDVRLLQTADLLVWQSAKYLKDKVNGSRPPRKDFASLIENQDQHMFQYLATQGSKWMLGADQRPDLANEGRDKTLRLVFSDPKNRAFTFKRVRNGWTALGADGYDLEES
jgi:Protein of unknown function (DUF3800)